MRSLAVVVPVFNESKNLFPFFSRLTSVCDAIKGIRFRFVFVNDGSLDGSWESLLSIADDDRVTLIDLSRNYGKEVALSAGVHHCVESEAVVCIDADLQHPPELIPSLIEAWYQGAEVVGTVRSSAEKNGTLRRLSSRLYYAVFNLLSEVRLESRSTDFGLYDRKVVEAFCQLTERERMFRGVIDWLGFKKVSVSFDVEERFAGRSTYSYRHLWRLAVNSVTSFSLLPLKLIGYLGVLITSLSASGMVWMLGANLLADVRLYTPLALVAVGNSFLIGIVLMGLGFIAMYIGRIHTEVVNRPLYIVRRVIQSGKVRA